MIFTMRDEYLEVIRGAIGNSLTQRFTREGGKITTIRHYSPFGADLSEGDEFIVLGERGEEYVYRGNKGYFQFRKDWSGWE